MEKVEVKPSRIRELFKLRVHYSQHMVEYEIGLFWVAFAAITVLALVL